MTFPGRTRDRRINPARDIGVGLVAVAVLCLSAAAFVARGGDGRPASSVDPPASGPPPIAVTVPVSAADPGPAAGSGPETANTPTTVSSGYSPYPVR